MPLDAQVENPIPFSDAQTRMLSTGFLHARYFVQLLAPLFLSADWSFACIPLVTQLSDPRNLATVALYAFLLWTLYASDLPAFVREVLGLGLDLEPQPQPPGSTCSRCASKPCLGNSSHALNF